MAIAIAATHAQHIAARAEVGVGRFVAVFGFIPIGVEALQHETEAIALRKAEIERRKPDPKHAFGLRKAELGGHVQPGNFVQALAEVHRQQLHRCVEGADLDSRGFEHVQAAHAAEGQAAIAQGERRGAVEFEILQAVLQVIA